MIFSVDGKVLHTICSDYMLLRFFLNDQVKRHIHCIIDPIKTLSLVKKP